jgi:hypothetical protein
MRPFNTILNVFCLDVISLAVNQHGTWTCDAELLL